MKSFALLGLLTVVIPVVDKPGFDWNTGNLAGDIGRLDPKDGSIKQYPMPDPMVRDPHTQVFDKSGDIWFTAQGGNAIGKLTVSSGKVQLLKVPTPNARPYGIKLDSKGHPWVVLFGTNKIATVDPGTMQLREITLPLAATPPRRGCPALRHGARRRGSRVGRRDLTAELVRLVRFEDAAVLRGNAGAERRRRGAAHVLRPSGEGHLVRHRQQHAGPGDRAAADTAGADAVDKRRGA